MITNGFKRKNVSQEYLIARKKQRNTILTIVPEPDDLDWAYVYNNEKLREFTKTSGITIFCKMQHFTYVAHITRLDNNFFSLPIIKNIPVTDR